MITHPTALEISADARRYTDLNGRAHVEEAAPRSHSPRRFAGMPRFRVPGFARPRRTAGSGEPASPIVPS